MLSARYIFRLIQAFFKRFKAIIFLSVFVGVIFFLIINFLIPNIISTTVKIGVIGRFTVNNLPSEITEKISRGLTKIDNEGNIIPDASDSWDTSDGGKTWNFKLKDNLIWQDGKKLTTADINYEFTDATLEKINEFNLKFNLQNKFSAFPVILTKPLFKRGLLGLGEYEVQKISLVGGLVQKLTIKNSKNERVIYKFYPTEERLILAFKLGEVDIIEGLQNVNEFGGWKKVHIDEEVNYNNFVALLFNTKEGGKFEDKAIRQSLNYAIDKDILGKERALSPISPFSWGYNSQVKKYVKDKEKVKDVKDLEIKISVLPNLLNTAEQILFQWKEFGVKSEVEVTSNIPTDFDVFLATVDIPKDPDQYSLWHSTQLGTNISRYNNPRIDKLLEDGRTELDQETRKKIYLDFQRFLVEESPAIFLYHPVFYRVSRK